MFIKRIRDNLPAYKAGVSYKILNAEQIGERYFDIRLTVENSLNSRWTFEINDPSFSECWDVSFGTIKDIREEFIWR